MTRIHDIKLAVAREFGVEAGDLEGDRRDRRVVIPRHLAFLLGYQMLGVSKARLGREFGRDHTSVMHGLRAIRRRIAKDDGLRARVETIRAALEDAQEIADNRMTELEKEVSRAIVRAFNTGVAHGERRLIKRLERSPVETPKPLSRKKMAGACLTDGCFNLRVAGPLCSACNAKRLSKAARGCSGRPDTRIGPHG